MYYFSSTIFIAIQLPRPFRCHRFSDNFKQNYLNLRIIMAEFSILCLPWN